LPPLWEDGVPMLKWYIRWTVDVVTGRHEQAASPVFDGMCGRGARRYIAPADGRTAEGIGPPCAASTDRCHGMVKA
jgi:hypothetical protein